MITTENITLKNGKQLIKTKSNSGFKIRQNGTDRVYNEAIDPVDAGRTYTETEEKIEERKSPEAPERKGPPFNFRKNG